MLITEAQMNIRKSNFNILDEMVYLGESVYSPAMVPIVENSEVGANLVRLEDVMAFSEANGIEDLGYALQLVCEADNVDPSTVAFTVQSTNVIVNENVADITKGIMEAGVTIYAIPVNEHCVESKMVDMAIDRFLSEADTSLLECFVSDDYTAFLEADDAKKQDGPKVTMTAGSDNPHQAARKMRDDQAAQRMQKQRDAAEAFGGDRNAIYKAIDAIKRGTVSGRDALAKLADRLNGYLRKVQDNINKTDPSERGPLTKLKAMIVNALEAITRKLHNVTQVNRGNIEKR